MATNAFFQNTTYRNEQELIDDLVLEAIKIHGIDVFYVTRSTRNEDQILNEDRVSIFNSAYPIEMYMKSVDGFGGEGDFLSKFGLTIRDQATLCIANRSFERFVTRFQPTVVRPREGDLVYMPLFRGFYEIMETEHESVFYQTGALQVFEVQVELFEYSNERFLTGNQEIDTFYKDEHGSADITDLTRLKAKDPVAKNIDYEDLINGVIDFDSIDPFSETVTNPTRTQSG